MVDVIKSQFIKPGVSGDFSHMIEQPEYQATLFVFNDNEEQFLAHFLAADNPFGAAALGINSLPSSVGGDPCSAGGGNAAIRPYQCAPHRRAVGIPTGDYRPKSPHYKGYLSLDAHVQQMIDYSISQIGAMLATSRFTSLAFSYNPETKLGGRIFNTAQVVRDYIFDELFRVADKY
jgi:hypothetical protein